MVEEIKDSHFIFPSDLAKVISDQPCSAFSIALVSLTYHFLSSDWPKTDSGQWPGASFGSSILRVRGRYVSTPQSSSHAFGSRKTYNLSE